MKCISFAFLINPNIVENDLKQVDIRSLDEKGLRQIGNGKIFIEFPEKRESIVIESEVLDYILQLKDVILDVDSGNFKTFTISRDFYSNNLQFTYDSENKKIEIYEGNNGEFRIITNYSDFRLNFLSFFKRALLDLELIYPDISLNQHFRDLKK